MAALSSCCRGNGDTHGRRVAICLSLLLGLMMPAVLASAHAADTASTGVGADSALAASDRRLVDRVTRALRTRDNVVLHELAVDVDAGVVTLHGLVATSAEKHLASRYVQDIPGIQGVVNAIIVDPVLGQSRPD